LFQEYAETAMNELLGWYGYDKLDSRDTQGLNLHHFAAQRSPSDLDSSDAEGARSSSSPGRRDAGTGSSQGSPPLPGKSCNITRWLAVHVCKFVLPKRLLVVSALATNSCIIEPITFAVHVYPFFRM
jgi:hypothetical protein